ncbi:Protein pih1d3 [Coelomomyces lativittatus]|nr:Protein pih1d3 [Coelomomyces lativittatus]KAJ1513752.1 Protein pih1d3 [Coelomomyces lativittatus]KAJ1515102.1 Protein pih1d3 [Coelomomyces lativittatus]
MDTYEIGQTVHGLTSLFGATQKSQPPIHPEKSRSPIRSKYEKGVKSQLSRTIWDSKDLHLEDSRIQPTYSMYYRHQVTTGDIYFGSTNSIKDAQILVIRIELPDTKKDEIQLDIDTFSLNLFTPNYMIELALPEVDGSSSTAEWDPEKYILKIMVPVANIY